MSEEEIQEEIMLATIKEWIKNPIKIELELEEEKEKEKEKAVSLSLYFKNRLGIEDSFYEKFDLFVEKFNKSLRGGLYINVNNIEITIRNKGE